MNLKEYRDYETNKEIYLNDSPAKILSIRSTLLTGISNQERNYSKLEYASPLHLFSISSPSPHPFFIPSSSLPHPSRRSHRSHCSHSLQLYAGSAHSSEAQQQQLEAGAAHHLPSHRPRQVQAAGQEA